MAKTKPIEEKIKEKYQVEEDDIWLIERGKTNEIRMIKESYYRIQYLKNIIENLKKEIESKEKAYFNQLTHNIAITAQYDKKLRRNVEINKKLINRYKKIKEVIIENEIIEQELEELRIIEEDN